MPPCRSYKDARCVCTGAETMWHWQEKKPTPTGEIPEGPAWGHGGDTPGRARRGWCPREVQSFPTQGVTGAQDKPVPSPLQDRLLVSPPALHLSRRIGTLHLLSTAEYPPTHPQPALCRSQFPPASALPIAATSSVRPQSPAPCHACTRLLQPVQASGDSGALLQATGLVVSQSEGGRRRAGGPS